MEAEIAAMFHNAQAAIPIRTMLEEMGYPQPATPMITNNIIAKSVINNTAKQRKSRAIDMNYYWMRDKVAQIFLNYLGKGHQ